MAKSAKKGSVALSAKPVPSATSSEEIAQVSDGSSADPGSKQARVIAPALRSSSLPAARAALPRNDRLVAQIVSLERRVSRAGKDSITHPEHGHDDLANAVAGAAMSQRYGSYNLFSGWLD
jgi:hypothetical protein